MADFSPEKLLGMIGLCKKAGKLTIGFDAVVEGAQRGEFDAVFRANDLSPKTLKELNYRLQGTEVTIITANVSMEQTEHIVGRRAGVFAVADIGLENKLIQLAGQQTGN